MKDKKIVETTSAGAIASVAMPMGNVQKRAGSLFKGKKTKKKFYETRFASKQQLIDYFVSTGKTAAQASAAWERGYRGPTAKKKKGSTKPPKEDWMTKHEREKEEREERNKKDLTEGKMKDLAHDIENMSPKEFLNKHKRTKEYFVKVLGDPSKLKNKSKKSVSEAEVLESDLIIVPGMRKMKDRSFVPHKADRRDHEVEMARSDVYAAAKDAMRIFKLLKNRTEDQGLMGWQQSYITLATDYLSSVADNIEYDSIKEGGGVIAGGMSNFEEGVTESMKIPARTKMMNYVQQVIGQNKGTFLRVTCPVSLQPVYDFLIDRLDSVNPSTEFSDSENKESSYVISKQILNIDGTKIPVAKIEYSDKNIESEDPYFYISISNIQKLKQTLNKQGVAEGFPYDVDHMPGKTIKHTNTNCTTCHGNRHMYKLDGKLFADNKPGSTKIKCPTCKGTGDKQGVTETKIVNFEGSNLEYEPHSSDHKSVKDILKAIGSEHRMLHDDYRRHPELFNGYVLQNLININRMLYQLTTYLGDKQREIDAQNKLDVPPGTYTGDVREEVHMPIMGEISNFEESENDKPRVNVPHLLEKMLQLQNKALMAIDRQRWSELNQIKNEMEEIENKVRSSGPGGDKTMDNFYKNIGNKKPIDVLDPTDTKKAVKENKWRNRLWSPYWSPSNQERKEQAASDSERRSAKRRELEAELGDEDRPSSNRPAVFNWYVRINGKVLKQKNGELFKFNSMTAANKAVNTMKSRPWNKDKTFTVTQSPFDDTGTIKENGHQDDTKEREENLRYSRSRADVADAVRKRIDPNNKEEKCPECGNEMVSEELMNEKKDACYYKVKSRYKVWPSAYASGALVKCRKKGASNWGKSKTNEDEKVDGRSLPRKAITPGNKNKNVFSLESLLDEYVLLQTQRSAALYRNRNDLALMYMEKMDELEELINAKKDGPEELAKVKAWVQNKNPDKAELETLSSGQISSKMKRTMVDFRRDGLSYADIAKRITNMSGVKYTMQNVKSYIESRPDYPDIQKEFIKIVGI